ncbi:MAG: molybdenum ABC transporter ATP-binding protein, partial [Pseudomonadota bacterium]
VLLDTESRRFLPPHRRRLGYVFQEARLFPHLSVRANLLYGRRFSGGGWPRIATGDPAEFDRVVALLGIEGLLTRRPQALSGGEKSRVAIGRALLSRPRLLLMDEPLASLDQARKNEILPYLERLRDETQIPILYVSHAVAEVARLATSIVVLDAGRVAQAGPAASVFADPTLAPLLGVRALGSILVGRVIRHHEDGLSEIAVSAGSLFLPRVEAAPGATLRVRIEAQDVILARDAPVGLSALNILPATVSAVQRGEGPGVVVQLQAGGDRLLARITQRSADRLGIAPGVACHGIVKAVAVARGDVGQSAEQLTLPGASGA